jgi:hypothetical protein
MELDALGIAAQIRALRPDQTPAPFTLGGL